MKEQAVGIFDFLFFRNFIPPHKLSHNFIPPYKLSFFQRSMEIISTQEILIYLRFSYAKY